MPGQREEKCGKLRAWPVLTTIPEQPHECFLHKIIRIIISAQAPKKVQQAVLVAANQEHERVLIAMLGRAHKFDIVKLIHQIAE